MAIEVGGTKWHRHPIVATVVGTIGGLIFFFVVIVPVAFAFGIGKFFKSPQQ